MSKDPEDRFETAGAMMRAAYGASGVAQQEGRGVHSAAEASPHSVQTPPRRTLSEAVPKEDGSPPPKPPRRSRRLAWSILAAVLGAAALVAIILLNGGGGSAVVLPSGVRVAFVEGAPPHIVVLDAGGGIKRFDPSAAHLDAVSSPSWDPAGTRIAFTGRAGSQSHIYVAQLRVGRQTELMKASAQDDRQPAWSPGGDSIAFVRSSADLGVGATLWIYSLKTDKAVEVARTEHAGSPSWSPDAKRIIFATEGGRRADIVAVGLDGSKPTIILSSGEKQFAGPTWSPDGRQIAFSSDLQTANRQLYVMDADGTNIHRVSYSEAKDSNPIWTPDGRSLVFVRTGDLLPELFIIDLETGQERPLLESTVSRVDPAVWPIPGASPSIATG